MAYSNLTGHPAPSDILRPWIDTTYFAEEHRARGEAVHAACAGYLLNGYSVIDTCYRGYFDSFKRWCDEHKPQPLITDNKRLVCRTYGYSGQPDFVGRLDRREGIGIADWKTSLALGKAWPLQVAAYRHLAGMNGYSTFWGCSVRLRSDGSRPLVKWYERFDLDFNVFLGCLNAYRHFH